MGKREFYEYNGEQMTLSQVERITGKDAETLRRRIRLGGMTLEEALSVEGRAIYSLDVLDRKKQQRKESGYCKRIALLLMREIFYSCTPREVRFRQMPNNRNIFAFGADVFEYRAEICRDCGDRAKLTAILRSSGEKIREWEYEICGNMIKRI